MPVHNFHKTRLVYQVLTLISQARHKLLEDLVAYSNDPVRFMRRLRILQNLAQYESQFLTSMRHFESDNAEDFDIMGTISLEIDAVSNVNA